MAHITISIDITDSFSKILIFSLLSNSSSYDLPLRLRAIKSLRVHEGGLRYNSWTNTHMSIKSCSKDSSYKTLNHYSLIHARHKLNALEIETS